MDCTMDCNDVNGDGFAYTNGKSKAKNSISMGSVYNELEGNDSSQVTRHRYAMNELSTSKLLCNKYDQINAKYHKELRSIHRKFFEEPSICPRCGMKMHEPRLLPCLHPICSSCTSELIDKSSQISSKKMYNKNHTEQMTSIHERCPLCDFILSNTNSMNLPPHYPLQHRLVMDAIHSGLAHRILCDICSDEVPALVQCSTCLRNFCADCGAEHQKYITVETKPSKHLVKPLWEATKVRRTLLCQIHPSYKLRYFCIACQQVTCRECMWSIHHRGHASEDASSAGKRAAIYLTKILQRAKALVNLLLTQYNDNIFLATCEEYQNVSGFSTYRYEKFTIS